MMSGLGQTLPANKRSGCTTRTVCLATSSRTLLGDAGRESELERLREARKNSGREPPPSGKAGHTEAAKKPILRANRRSFLKEPDFYLWHVGGDCQKLRAIVKAGISSSQVLLAKKQKIILDVRLFCRVRGQVADVGTSMTISPILCSGRKVRSAYYQLLS